MTQNVTLKQVLQVKNKLKVRNLSEEEKLRQEKELDDLYNSIKFPNLNFPQSKKKKKYPK